MKLSYLALTALLGTANAKHSDKKKEEDKCPAVFDVPSPGPTSSYPVGDYKHYLVGLLTFQFQLDGLTTGRKAFETPLEYIPNVGVTDIEPCIERIDIVDEKGVILETFYRKKFAQFVLLKDEGYGTSDKSDDFPLHFHVATIQKPFVYNHGDTIFDIYTPFEALETLFIKDPAKLISWQSEWDGHILDIQTQYAAPANWNELVANRVLTGRDLSPEGIAVFEEDCAVVAEKWGPSIFAMDVLTGEVKSPLVYVNDIFNLTAPVLLDDYFLTTISDKRHCYLHEVVSNQCGIVDDERVDSNGYYDYIKNAEGKKEKVFIPKFNKISPNAGWAGLAYIPSAKIIYGIFQESIKYSDGAGEPGPRIYEIYPGDCTADCPPSINGFLGWYKLSTNANRVAAVTPIQSSPDRLLVHEHNSGFPSGKFFPRGTMPADKLCIVKLFRDFPVLQDVKKCILNYMHISDPYDVDHNGSGVYAQSQKSNSGLVVVDDYCFIGGTDPNWPLDHNDYGLDMEADSVPFYVEAVESTRFFIVCYYEPIFNPGYELF